MINEERNTQIKEKKKWPLKIIIEVFPLFMALTAFLSFGALRQDGEKEEVLAPLSEVMAVLPAWMAVVMGLLLLIGISAIVFGVYIFSRSPITSPEGNVPENIVE